MNACEWAKSCGTLGLILDGRLPFAEHFNRLAPKLEGIATLLGRLLPNIRGPGDKVHRPYTGL